MSKTYKLTINLAPVAQARPRAVGALDLMVGNFAVEGLEGWVFSPFYPYLTTDGDITDCKTEEQAIARGWSWQSKHWKSTRGFVMAMKISDLQELRDMISDLEVDIEAALDMARRTYSDGGPYSKNKLPNEYIKFRFIDINSSLNLAYAGINYAFDSIDRAIDRLEEEQ